MAELDAVFRRHPVRNGYLAVFGIVAIAALVAGLVAPDSQAATLFRVFAFLAAIPAAFWSARWLWRRLTYRVGVRLFFSYLLIGLTPFLLMAILSAIAGYILIGQYASVRLGQELDDLGERSGARVTAAVQKLLAAGPQPAQALFVGPVAPGDPAFTWILAQGDRVWRSEGGLEPAAPTWAPEGRWRGAVLVGKTLMMAAIERRGDTIAALLIPLDVANAARISPLHWFRARFLTSETLARVGKRGADKTVTVTIGGGPEKETGALRIDGEPVSPDQLEPGWLDAKADLSTASGRTDASRWRRIQVAWVRILETPRSWRDGSAASGMLAVAVMKVSVGGAADDLFAGPARMGSEVRTALSLLAIVFGGVYLIAVSFAVVMILSVARSTARLTRGARAVARGDLDHRIPVKRRDQLGDLAVSFNSMTESVKTMLVQVAEKERMAREMELAREIQESLLPPSELSAGPLSVWAHFRPAAEVGGDYFDLFPLASGRLAVAVGDVAGHGLHTGLLMAMVKSAVATLIGEGHSGRALLERLNRLLLAQPVRHRMVSLAFAEFDASRAEVEITSAGHPPGMLLAAGGDVEELLMSSLPLGHRWPEPPPTISLGFEPGSRLLLYSDGLVEARAADGEPFGYEALRDALRAHGEAPASTLISAVLAALDRRLGGQPLADDLTLLLVEHRRGPVQAGGD